MSLREICDKATLLSNDEKTQLATFILDSLDQGHHEVSDDEVRARAKQLRENSSTGLTREEFNKACGR